MGLVLDTSVVVGAERQRFDFATFLRTEAADMPLFVSAMTASELLHGVHRSDDLHRTKREKFVGEILSRIPILDFDEGAARKHAELRAQLEKTGNVIGPYDLIIAATALSKGHSLATLNEKEFERVPGLALLNTKDYLTKS